jgi:uncharacterized SAM-binding protein YcdF (DUF218 family)
MTAGKILTEPIFILLVIALLSLIISFFRQRAARGALLVPAATVLALWILSLPVTAIQLQHSLDIVPLEDAFVPEVIDVPGGGFSYRTDELTQLSGDSVGRVLTAVRWWQIYPTARLVMSGSDGQIVPGVSMSHAMAELAIARGVPRSQVFYESRSLNTRQHPEELLRFPFVTSATKIGVVTSYWHLRRALHSFRQRFILVEGHPAPPELLPDDFMDQWIPSAEGLISSTGMIQEWIGLVWYHMRDAAEVLQRRAS